MNTNRNRYSTAPTYGMLRRGAAKKQVQTPPPVQPFTPIPQPPYGPGAGQPQQQPYFAPANAAMPQAPVYPPMQPAYASTASGYAQPAYGQMPQQSAASPAGQGYRPAPYQPAAAPLQQPLPYMPPQTYAPQSFPQEYAVRQKPRQQDTWLQICLLGILPLLFIGTFFIAGEALKWAFLILAGICLAAMWLQRSFVPSARTTLTLVYGALMLVCAVSLFASAAPRDQTTSAGLYNNQGQGQVQPPTATQTPAPQNGMVPTNNNGEPDLSAVALSEEDNTTMLGESQAEQQLKMFFDFWIVKKQDEMLNLVAPSWASLQETPAKSLFFILTNRTPLDYTFENISGSDSDSSRTITLTANIDKNNGREPVKIRFQVLMLKENGTWYVDPKSLSSNDEVAEQTPVVNENGATPTPSAQPTSTPAPKTKLYYNEDGGKYYHSVSDCDAVNKKYIPLTSFYYKDLNTDKFKGLNPCPDCDPPTRP